MSAAQVVFRRRLRLGFMAGLALLLAAAPGADAQSVTGLRPTIRDLVIGQPVAAQPTEYQEFACGTNGGPASIPLTGFDQFARCPAEASGLHEVVFRYDDEAHFIALAHRDALQADLFAGTRLGNFAILASALFDDAGILRGIRAVTDDRIEDRDRRVAYGMADYVRTLYLVDGWTCADLPAEAGETPVGNSFIKQDCHKVAGGQALFTSARLFRRPGQSLIDPANGQLRVGLYESTARFEAFAADADGNPVYAGPETLAVAVAEPSPPPADPVQAFLGGFTNDCPGCDLAGAELKGRDLAGSNLRGANLAGATLHRALLGGAHLDGANLAGANLNVADLKRASLVGANLAKALLYQADAAGADFTNAILDDAVAERARFTSGTMVGVHWANAYAIDANFAGTNLSQAVLTAAVFVQADMQRANLSGADVTDASFYRTRLRGADLTGAIALRADFLEADLSNAKLIGADLTSARLLRARSSDLDLTNAHFDATIMPDGRTAP